MFKEKKLINGIGTGLVAAILLFTVIGGASAASKKTDVVGSIYEFSKDDHYEFTDASPVATSNAKAAYGAFSISGDIKKTFAKDGVTAFEIPTGTLSLLYTYDSTLFNASEDEWHLVEDKSKKVDQVTLKGNIAKGVIIVQTSLDRKNWVDAGSYTNVFAEVIADAKNVYTTKDIELLNGCYYRVVVAYELSRRTEQSNFLFVDTSNYESKKIAEVYEFYACTEATKADLPDSANTYRIGSPTRTKQFEGYFGEKDIVQDDPHYDVTIGDFYVSGYAEKKSETDGSVVFLKNVGDKITLWFALKENINAIGGNEKVKVTPDEKGYDQYFQTQQCDFGRGTLIVRHTDSNNNSSEPQIYTNFLEANTSVGADTKICLFEEGDYEVALDYELTEDKIIDTVAHYRIYFKFSIRNSNCMVYLFDLKTNSELSNRAITENGFRLDLAKSKYLNVFVKRETLAESANVLVEDTRFNGAAKDGAEFRSEGIYTITVTSQYIPEPTEKIVYVGTNSVLKAYAWARANHKDLSIQEIYNQLEQGATIEEDGSITQPPAPSPEPEATPSADSGPVPSNSSEVLPASVPAAVSSTAPEPALSADPEAFPAETPAEELSAGISITAVVGIGIAIVAISAAAVIVVNKITHAKGKPKGGNSQ